jgi:taurine dioxygenase
VRGIDLAKSLSSTDVDDLHAALLEHLVLVFRNQDITPEQQVTFARHFGEISPSPIAPKYGSSPDYIVLDQTAPKGEGADRWHSDNTFMAEPPMGSILRAVQLPDVGGDTCFASMYAAYEALSPRFQQLVDGLRAVHDITAALQRALAAGHTTADLREMQERWPPVEHPVVRTHPVTGRKALFVSGSTTSRILDLEESEADVLLRFLVEHVRSPAFQCRIHWEPDTVLFWDNRPVQHYAVPDYSERRVMHRVTLAGDRPV